MNGIFRKYIMVTVSIVLISFMFMGGFLAWFAYRSAGGEKRLQLQEDCIETSHNLAISTESGMKAIQMVVRDNIENMAKKRSYNIVVTDSDGLVAAFIGQDDYSNHLGKQVPSFPLEMAIKEGQYSGVGDFNKFYGSSITYTTGAPIILSTGEIIGAVFITSYDTVLYEMLHTVTQMFIPSAIAAIFIAVLLSYAMTRRMVEPLRQMSSAAQSYANGDFDTKITITSDDEIGELAAALNNMSLSLSRIEKTRREFVANVSHELRTPMTTIAGFIEGILDKTIPEEKQEEYLAVVSQEVQRLTRLVNGLLSLSRIENDGQKIEYTRFDICKTISNIAFSFEKQINEKNITVNLNYEDHAVFIMADRDMMTQVVHNLLHNAVKFTKENGEINVKVSSEGKKALISVYNTGDGIPKDELPVVFDRFYKCDKSRGMDKSGSGLGLYIVRQIIALHNENITVNSVEGEYCEFIFTIEKAKR